MRVLVVALMVLLTTMLTGCDAAAEEQISSAEMVRARLDGIPPKYDRDKYFGGSWKQVRARCDVREILIERASGQEAVDTDRDGCRDDGSFFDPYTGLVLTAAQAEVDHVYPVKKFWDANGWDRSQQERADFYQDQNNLILVQAEANQQKSDLGPDQWRPGRGEAHCEFARKYTYTVVKYSQPVTPSESAALKSMLATCPKG